MSDVRQLPPVHALVDNAALADVEAACGRELVVEAVREALDAARGRTLAGGSVPDEEALIADVRARVKDWIEPRPRPVINAAGVIIHTNLGRAPISPEAAVAMGHVATGYSDLEYDLGAGERGSRHTLVEPILCRLTGAEAALVVNNNAGATLLVLSALARGKGVIVSRGQLVEIGGGFRIPDVMAAGGARLVEVGTTNRTRLADYRAAIDEETALILRVHTSNYRIVGFAEEAALAELVALGRETGLPVVDDLGSGSLLDTAPFGLAREPVVTESLQTGAGLVTFSGDKLLGGPQAGVIIGHEALVARLRAHPFARALRPGKTTLAGLHATLLHYLRREALEKVPVWRMIATTPEQVEARARAWRAALAERSVEARLQPGQSAMGGGSLPGETLPTTLLALDVPQPDAFAAVLRAGDPPIIARIDEGAVVLDPRTVLPEEDEAVVDGLFRALDGRGDSEA